MAPASVACRLSGIGESGDAELSSDVFSEAVVRGFVAHDFTELRAIIDHCPARRKELGARLCREGLTGLLPLLTGDSASELEARVLRQARAIRLRLEVVIQDVRRTILRSGSDAWFAGDAGAADLFMPEWWTPAVPEIRLICRSSRDREQLLKTLSRQLLRPALLLRLVPPYRWWQPEIICRRQGISLVLADSPGMPVVSGGMCGEDSPSGAVLTREKLLLEQLLLSAAEGDRSALSLRRLLLTARLCEVVDSDNRWSYMLSSAARWGLEHYVAQRVSDLSAWIAVDGWLPHARQDGLIRSGIRERIFSPSSQRDLFRQLVPRRFRRSSVRGKRASLFGYFSPSCMLNG